MLSRSHTVALKTSTKSHIRAVAVSKTLLRFNSTDAAATESNANESKGFKSKPLFNTYTSFLKSQKLNEQGEFIVERPTENDYENSELAKHLQHAKSEKDKLIDEKLKALAELNNVKFEDLKKKFDAKVDAKISLINSKNAEILSKIEKFTHLLALPVNGPSNLISDLLDGLLPFAENLNDAAAFKYIYEIDPVFAKAFGKVVRTEPTQESVNELAEAFKSGSISKITDVQYEELKSLLSNGQTLSSQEPAKSEISENIEEQPIDGLAVLETIFSNLNCYENIDNSPLLKLITEIDNEFAILLKSYETINPSDETALKSKYEEILNYCSDKKSKIFKAFGDINSPDFTKVKKVLEEPLPIDLSEIYEVFEFYPDYFNSALFKSINEIDPAFGNLLNELETLPEGEGLDAKNDEIDAYLSNIETPIYTAMNNTTSKSFESLRSVLESEWEKMESTVTPDKLIEYVVQNGLESDGFKVISKIDPEFADIVVKLYGEEDNEKAMEIYATLQEYLQTPNAITGALEDKESLNYQLLADNIFLKQNEEISTDIEPNTADELIITKEDNALTELQNEDQSQLPEDVTKMNQMYDLTLDIINEIEEELTNNTFIPVSRQVSNKMDKLLGFQPSTEQVLSSESLKGKDLPKQKDEVLELAVNIIMKDGKKEIARKHLNRALYLLFLETRSNPVDKLKEALDIVAPIVVTKTVKTGFAKNYTVPVPLTQRQRNRMALLWILNSCDSKASNDFSVRLCDEILHVLTGKSSLMDKRVLSHKMAIANRSYLTI